MPINEFKVYKADGLGQAVRAFREQAGLSQSELADRVGIRQSYLSELETGHVNEQLRRLVELYKALGVRIVVEQADW
jgi:HTH-type transcriptional regulator/antitoxin HipB